MKERKPTKLLQRIFELRKQNKITLAELGKVMGNVTGSTASDIENGYVPLKAEHLPAIAKLLGVKTWELFLTYQDKEVGPLSEEEKTIILETRKRLPKAADKKVLADLLKRLEGVSK